MRVGNDVVDLRDAETGSVHPRFDARVFDERERLALARSPDADALRWRLWAAKEAAYKLCRKLDSGCAFRPSRFAVEPGVEGPDRVQFGRRRLEVEVELEGDAVHAVAREWGAGGRGLVQGLRRLDGAPSPESLSDAVRRLAAEVLAPKLGVASSQIEFARCGRIPELRVEGQSVGVDLSLSHHGGVVAFAARLLPAAT